MIKLDVKDYCHDCHHFEAAIEVPDAIIDGFGKLQYLGDYLIRCKHDDICNDLLERKVK